MSVFRVKLNNVEQGQMDLDPSTASSISGMNYSQLGSQFSASKQRTIYVAGPGRTYRKLHDGDTFTDCNYWKRFAYPQVALHEAFIEVVSDDGSVWSDVASENVYPKVYDLSVAAGSDFDDNVVDVLGDTGGYAVFVQIANQGSTAVRVRVNGVANAIFDLAASETQVFNSGDMAVTKLEFMNVVSGGADSDVQVLMSVRSVANS